MQSSAIVAGALPVAVASSFVLLPAATPFLALGVTPQQATTIWRNGGVTTIDDLTSLSQEEAAHRFGTELAVKVADGLSRAGLSFRAVGDDDLDVLDIKAGLKWQLVRNLRRAGITSLSALRQLSPQQLRHLGDNSDNKYVRNISDAHIPFLDRALQARGLSLSSAYRSTLKRWNLDVPEGERGWGYYTVPQGVPVRTALPPLRIGDAHFGRDDKILLANNDVDRIGVDRVYDHRFRTAFWESTELDPSTASAIVLFLPGAGTEFSTGASHVTSIRKFAQAGIFGVSIDPPFHGHGPREDVPRGLDAWLSWVDSIVQYLSNRYQKPVYRVGRSFGANTVIQYAIRYPERGRNIAMSGFFLDWLAHDIEQLRARAAAGRRVINEEGLEWALEIDHAFDWYDRPELPLGAELMVLSGDTDDEYPFGYYERWRELGERWNIPVVIIPGGGHNLYADHPDRTDIPREAVEHTLRFLGHA